MDRRDIGWFIAGFIAGPALLNVSPVVTGFFWWVGAVSLGLLLLCILMALLGIVPFEWEDMQ